MGLAVGIVADAYTAPPSGLPVAGAIMWYDASDAASITATTGSVNQWNDKTASGRHVTAATTARPTTGTRTQNGRNVLDFDGTSDWMSTVAFTRAQPVTIFAVAAADIISGTRHLISLDTTNPAIYHITASTAMYAGTGLQLPGSANTAAHVFVGVFNGASSALFRDGTSLVTGNAGTNGWTSHRMRIGGHAAEYWDGWIAEVVVYPSALSTGDRQAVETYLRTKWDTVTAYALVEDDTVVEHGALPPVWNDGERDWDLRPMEDPELADLGWLPVTTTPRPPDTATTTHDYTVELVADTPTEVWTPRPMTTDEAAGFEANANVTQMTTESAEAVDKLVAVVEALNVITALTNAAVNQNPAAVIKDVARELKTVARQVNREARMTSGETDSTYTGPEESP